MSRPSRYEPEVLDYINKSDTGVTAAQLVDDLGCSVPHAYRTMKKLHGEGLLKIVGKTNTGAVQYTLAHPLERDQVVRVSKVEMRVNPRGRYYVVTVSSEDPDVADKVKDLIESAA